MRLRSSAEARKLTWQKTRKIIKRNKIQDHIRSALVKKQKNPDSRFPEKFIIIYKRSVYIARYYRSYNKKQLRLVGRSPRSLRRMAKDLMRYDPQLYDYDEDRWYEKLHAITHLFKIKNIPKRKTESDRTALIIWLLRKKIRNSNYLPPP